MRIALAVALLLWSTTGHAEPAQADVPKRIAKIMARGDGLTPETAFKVSSVRDEYEIVNALGLQRSAQSLVIEKRPYDVIEATDREGKVHKLWFDISRFFPAF